MRRHYASTRYRVCRAIAVEIAAEVEGIGVAGLIRKSLDAPEETRTFSNGKLELVNLDTGPVGRATFEPGWRWSTDVKPIAGTQTCQTAHMGYVVAGRMVVTVVLRSWIMW